MPWLMTNGPQVATPTAEMSATAMPASTALANHANDLLRQRVVVTHLGRGFRDFAAHALGVSHIHGHFGAANIDTGHRRAAGGQLNKGV